MVVLCHSTCDRGADVTTVVAKKKAAPAGKVVYSSKIIKAGALLADAKTLLANWDEARSVTDNLQRFRRENLFGKASRSRIEDILAIFRQRYLLDEEVTRSLAVLVQEGLPVESQDRLLYFHAARADPLLHDVVLRVLAPLYTQGRSEITVADLERPLAGWVAEGKTSGRWSEGTVRRVAQGLLSTLRDFGVLQGAVRKRLAPAALPVTAFAYIAFFLRRSGATGERLVGHPDWGLFFLPRVGVERLFVEAHLLGLLEYHAAGAVVRVEFPAETLEDYARVIADRPA
jgi:hypothetical protein